MLLYSIFNFKLLFFNLNMTILPLLLQFTPFSDKVSCLWADLGQGLHCGLPAGTHLALVWGRAPDQRGFQCSTSLSEIYLVRLFLWGLSEEMHLKQQHMACAQQMLAGHYYDQITVHDDHFYLGEESICWCLFKYNRYI